MYTCNPLSSITDIDSGRYSLAYEGMYYVLPILTAQRIGETSVSEEVYIERKEMLAMIPPASATLNTAKIY